MATDRSPLQQVSDTVFSRIESLRNEQVDTQTPFGFERLDKVEAKKRLQNMGSQARKRLIDKIGLDNVFKIIGD